MVFKNLKKSIFIIVAIFLLLVLLSQTTFGKRVFFEAGVIDAIYNFLNLKGDTLSAADYKEGTILLVKPLATGVGEGRYEAGDIVEIRDGEEMYKRFGNGNFLGKEERTRLLPLYYPGKLTEEQKQELLAPEYEEIPSANTKSPEEDVRNNKKIVKRRQIGIDYTQFLSSREILKVRQFKELKKLPEIDLSHIIKKENGFSLEQLTNNESGIIVENKKSGLSVDSWREASNQKLPLDNSNSIFANNRQSAGNFGSFSEGEKNQNSIYDLFLIHLPNQNNDYSCAACDIETKNIAKLPVIGEQNSFTFDSEVKNIFIAGASQPRFFNRENIKSPLFDSQNKVFVNALIGDNFEHKEGGLFSSGLQFQNFFFSQASSRVTQSHFDILDRQIRILLGNLFNGVAGLQKIQNISDGDSCSFNTRLAKSYRLLNDNTPAFIGFGSNPFHINNYRANKDNVNSVVHLPKHLQLFENTINTVKKIVRTIVKPVFAQAEVVRIVDTGNGPGTDYTSLNAWEAAMQKNLVTANEISVAKCRATTGAADTTDVAIDGWTTGPNNYIKIWTDPNEPYRHNGKWDEGKYRLQLSSATIIYVYEENTRIEGLQLYNTRNNSDGAEIITVYFTGTTDFRVSHNILRGANRDDFGGRGLYVNTGGPGSQTKIWNNIIYDVNRAAASRRAGLMLRGSENQTFYVYNNTIINCYDGISRGDFGTIILKNNLVQDSVNEDYNRETWQPEYQGDYNLSEDNTAPGNNSRRNTIVNFVDKPNRDLRLAFADTGAKDYGTNLSADTNLAFSDDIEGQIRSGSWDIGADEYQTQPIYRSVGPSNTTALASSTGQTLTIAGDTAIFSQGLPDRIGVGDVIVYNSVGTTTQNSIAFIHSRISATTYTVKNSAGKTPNQTASSTNWQIFRAYISLANAENGTENTGIPSALRNFDTWSNGKNLASSTEQWNIACYGDAVDTAASEFDESWTTTADNYIRIFTPVSASEVGTSQRHNGKWDEGKYRLVVSQTFSGAIGIRTPFIRIIGLQIENTNTSGESVWGIRSRHSHGSNSDVRIISNILKGNDPGSPGSGVFSGYRQEWDTNIFLVNNISYGWNRGFDRILLNTNGKAVIYNNTAVNNRTEGFTFYWGYPSPPFYIYGKNNLAVNNGTNYWYDGSGAGTIVWEKNLSGDNSSPNTELRNKTVTFADPANRDFRLQIGDSGARNNGVNLSNDPHLAFSDDIEGQQRPETGPWDIGADEVVKTTVINPTSSHKTQVNTPITLYGPQSGLVGHWTFNGQDTTWTSETTGTTADRSGNGNTGTMMNMSRSTSPAIGKIGQALRFDRVDDYVNAGSASSLDNLSAISISAWAKPAPEEFPYQEGMIAAKRGGASDGWWFTINNSYFAAYFIVDYTLTDIVKHFSCISCTGSVNAWNHFVLTWNGSSSAAGVRMFINGLEITQVHYEQNGSGSRVTDETADLVIGARSDGGGPRFNGLIDEVRIYNRVLSASEIQELYRLGTRKFQPTQ